MKIVAFISVIMLIVLMFAGSSISYAEEKKADNSIFEFKKELLLTDKQEKDLRKIVEKLQSALTKKQKELKSLQAEISKMIVEHEKLDKIKTKLYSMAKIRAEATYEDIAATRAIETELTGAQLAKWRGMQAEFARNLKAAQKAQVAATKEKEGVK